MSAPPGSASSTSTTNGMERLRLLSCNIVAGASVGRYRDYVTRSWLPHPGKRANLEALARSMEEFDVVGLQEADAGTLRSGFVNQTQYVAESAGFPYWSHQPNRRVSRLAQSANGLISRIEPTEVIDHPLPGRIPGRGALLARFGSGADALSVVISHLSLGPEARMRQLGFIAELLADAPHAVLMGDLNCAADSPELRELYRKTTLTPPIAPPPTFPSWRPRRAIDHILVSENLQIDSLWTLPQAFSDHLPVAASVTLPRGLQQELRRAA
ncbi:endonuclease/exonuclease/phosphatase family protein [Tahibacter harae]|uniref:Endonuclease/exonuclease/phosphatase family protein n=1 Tax=Tahibacter harae TaxID=2963937 RepID=A0ABT1QYM9_9GAMM|nr:endonuclease/exonuclease/phosphatase family protein [Tahibacter harae]